MVDGKISDSKPEIIINRVGWKKW